MLFRILTSCTGSKVVTNDGQLTPEDIRQGADHIAERSRALAADCRPASAMYDGAQHRLLMDGVRELKRQQPHIAIDLWIVSAGFGLISADQPIPPYNVSFTGMGKMAIREWAALLKLPDAARALLLKPADCCLLLLGQSYLTALDLLPATPVTPPTIAICSTAKGLPSAIQPLQLLVKDTTVFGQGQVGLKGKVASYILVYS